MFLVPEERLRYSGKSMAKEFKRDQTRTLDDCYVEGGEISDDYEVTSKTGRSSKPSKPRSRSCTGIFSLESLNKIQLAALQSPKPVLSTGLLGKLNNYAKYYLNFKELKGTSPLSVQKTSLKSEQELGRNRRAPWLRQNGCSVQSALVKGREP